MRVAEKDTVGAEEAIGAGGAVGDSEPIVGLTPGMEYRKARDTVTMAIAKLTARRAQGYVDDDAELVASAGEGIARATEVLNGLDLSDQAGVSAVQEEYLAYSRSIPSVSRDVLERYDRLVLESASGER